jgi:predicted transcriptional regulator of viral defense system
MDIHQMVTQPQLDVYTTVTKQIRDQKILGTDFHFVTNKAEHFFGLQKHWVDKSEVVLVSDLEKTVLDGLKMPEYCGGITEVAKGFWMKRQEMSVTKLVDYAEKLNVGAVYRRLGFLLATYDMPCPSELERLQRKMNSSYLLLDPTLPSEGKYQVRWRLRLNITRDELLAVVRT